MSGTEIPATIINTTWGGSLESNQWHTTWGPAVLTVEINVDQLQHLDLTRPITICQETP